MNARIVQTKLMHLSENSAGIRLLRQAAFLIILCAPVTVRGISDFVTRNDLLQHAR